MSGSVDAAAAILGDRATRDAPFGALTTYRVGGRAALAVVVHDDDDLERVSTARRDTGISVVVLGRGSNLLVADAGFDGLLVILGDEFSMIEIDGTTVQAGAAASLPVVARTTAAAGLRGFEWAVGVPGSVGGAVRMNAGGHGCDMAAVTARVRVVDLDSGKDVVVSATDLDLGYRRSSIGPIDLVVWAELALARGRRGRRRGGDRRHRPLASGEPARWSERGLGVHEPDRRLGRPPDRRAGAQGLPCRQRSRVGEARQLHPGRRRWIGRRRAHAHADGRGARP